MKKSELKQTIRKILSERTATEYIVWGIPPNKKEEEILFTKAKTHSEAKKVCDILEKKHGCKKCRVQTLDLSTDPDFKNVFNEAKDDELSVGIEVEMEHTSDRKKAKEIALDHLTENPKYYTELIKSGLVDEKPALELAKKLGLSEQRFKETQRWAFSRSELKAPDLLKSDDKLLSLCGHKYGLFVLRNGEVTGKRTDGTDATKQEIFDAEEDRELVHPKIKERTIEWKDIYVDKNENFIEFFEDPSLSAYKPVYIDDRWGNLYKFQGGGQFKKEQIIKIVKEEVRKIMREFTSPEAEFRNLVQILMDSPSWQSDIGKLLKNYKITGLPPKNELIKLQQKLKKIKNKSAHDERAIDMLATILQQI